MRSLVNQIYQNSIGWLTAAYGCLFPQTSLSSKLANRVAEAGFEVALDPPADGKCFYHAASFQLGFSPSTLSETDMGGRQVRAENMVRSFRNTPK